MRQRYAYLVTSFVDKSIAAILRFVSLLNIENDS